MVVFDFIPLNAQECCWIESEVSNVETSTFFDLYSDEGFYFELFKKRV